MMQGAVCLTKFRYYPDVQYMTSNERYDVGVLLGHCRARPCQL